MESELDKVNQYYLNENFHKEGIQNLIGFRDLTDLNCDNVKFEKYILASDNMGKLLKAQIIEYMQDKKGITVAEDLLAEWEILKSENYMSINISERWEEADNTLNNLIIASLFE